MPERRPPGPRRAGALQRWALNHARAFVFSVGQLWRSAGNSLLTAAVIGIALALPAALHLALENLRALAGVTDAEPQLSVFVERDAAPGALADLREELAGHEAIRAVELITPAEGLAALEQRLGLDDALTLLEDNPLPPVLVVTARAGRLEPAAAATLARELEARAIVAEVSVDLAWLRRLQALAAIGERLALLAAVLVALGVILVVGNTIRLNIATRRAEIEIQALFGATEAFIRRPFVYAGLLLGLAGGVFAAVVCLGSILWLAPAVESLLVLYGRREAIAGPGPGTLGALLAAGAAMGALGARIAVGRHLGRFAHLEKY